MVRIQFKPHLAPTLAFVFFLPILISLGFWQLDRADQKRRLQALFDARMHNAPVAIGEKKVDAENMRFQRVDISGFYDIDNSVYLDNRVRAGRAGYHVITPLRLARSQTRVLINRGWIPLGKDRSHLPDVTPPSGRQHIQGIATVPHEKSFRLAPAESLRDKWQSIWQHMDMKRYAGAVPFPVQPVVVLLDPDSQSGGFVREWKRLDTGIAVHQGYAFQWFSLAVALVAIFLFVNFRKSSRTYD